MKKSIFICALTVLFALPAGAQYIGTVRVKDAAVSAGADSVRVGFMMQIDREASQWFQGILLTPALTDGDPELPGTNIAELPSVELQGKNKDRAADRGVRVLGKKNRAGFDHPDIELRMTKTTDTLLRYDYAVPYEPWMDNARLSLYQEIVDFRNERQLFVLSIGEAVKPRVVEVAVPVIVEPVREIVEVVVPAAPEKRVLEGEAFIEFPVNGTGILPGFRNNAAELAQLRDVLSSVQNTPGVTIDSLAIEGCASVEGAYAYNERLAHDRSMAMKDYILNNFDLPLRDKISVSWVPEDWDGLARLVEHSNIRYKHEILDIIDNTLIFDGREARLMRLGGGVPYHIMYSEMFPQLRRVKYRIEYTVAN